MELIRVFERDRATPGAVRLAVSDLAERIPAETYHDLQTVLTELVSNAIRYGGVGSGIRVWLEVSADGAVRGEVADTGEGGAAIDHDRPPESGGLGLQIVDALCSAWCNPAGTGRVRFVLDPPAAA